MYLKRLDNERGIALVIGLFVLITLMGFSTIFIVRTVHESNATKAELDLVKSFYYAEAGTETALDDLDNLINNFMQTTVNNTNPSVVINDATTFVSGNDGIGFLIDYVEDAGSVEVLSAFNGTAVFEVNNTAFGNGEHDYTITISEKTDPVTVTADMWDFPYDYTIQASGSDETCAAQLESTDLAMNTGGTTLTSADGGFTSAMVGCYVHIMSGINFVPGYYEIVAYTSGNSVTLEGDATSGANASLGRANTSAGLHRDVLVTGDFTVRVRRDNFARYALFTNNQQTPWGANVWFTSRTNFSGPIHTNGRYNIYGNPSGTFYGVAEQYEQEARFYNGSSPSILADADFNGSVDVPTWAGGFNRGVDAITLSSPVQEQDMIDQAQGGATISGNGIYVPSSGGALSGGIYVEGDGTVSMSVDASGNAVYDIVQGANQKIITVDRGANQTSVLTVGTGTTVYTGLPDGIDDVGTLIYFNGDINNISGTVETDTEITIGRE